MVYEAEIISLRSENFPRKVYSFGGFSVVKVITEGIFHARIIPKHSQHYGSDLVYCMMA